MTARLVSEDLRTLRTVEAWADERGRHLRRTRGAVRSFPGVLGCRFLAAFARRAAAAIAHNGSLASDERVDQGRVSRL